MKYCGREANKARGEVKCAVLETSRGTVQECSEKEYSLIEACVA